MRIADDPAVILGPVADREQRLARGRGGQQTVLGMADCAQVGLPPVIRDIAVDRQPGLAAAGDELDLFGRDLQ